MKNGYRILLGGVPFGRNNIGDESILENVVGIVRAARPDAQLVVSSDRGQDTVAKLGVETVELFGFEPPYSRTTMIETLQTCEAFVWSGATGLSDYPEIPLEMLDIAQRAGKRTIVWGVGMNSQLNPVKYRLQPGKRKSVLELAGLLSLGMLDLVSAEEARREKRARAKIADCLSRADLVALRDPESLAEARRCAPLPQAMVGADSALLQNVADWNQIEVERPLRDFLNSDAGKVGICISAQREVADSSSLLDCFDRMIESLGVGIVFIPMNPVTDTQLMRGLQARMRNPDRVHMPSGISEPDQIAGIAGRMDCVISSRLHLLILASISHVPIIGISRGSKVDNYLHQYGLESVGSVDDCDFKLLFQETERLLNEREEFAVKSRRVRSDLLGRMQTARERLAEVLI